VTHQRQQHPECILSLRCTAASELKAERDPQVLGQLEQHAAVYQTAYTCAPVHHAMLPVASLQQHWARNVLDAGKSCAGNSNGKHSWSSTSASACTGCADVSSFQLKQLREKVTANAAVSVSHLSQLRALDLSLEQLTDINGLGQLCPQLQVKPLEASTECGEKGPG
jgi:hypothetical protein